MLIDESIKERIYELEDIAKSAHDDDPDNEYLEGYWDGLHHAAKELSTTPTVDAVPVVRCEKCRHGIKAHGISDGWVLCSKPYVTDTVGNMMHRRDWFCADGETRTDEQ